MSNNLPNLVSKFISKPQLSMIFVQKHTRSLTQNDTTQQQNTKQHPRLRHLHSPPKCGAVLRQCGSHPHDLACVWNSVHAW